VRRFRLRVNLNRIGALSVLATYEVVCSKYPDAEAGKAVKAFLQSTIGGGEFDLTEHGYIPLPEDFQAKVVTAVNAIS
jgi:phosphate transport system substrate-binding protein